MALKALVATADPAIFAQFEGLLRGEGLEVELVKDGDLAFASIDRACPDFALVDLSLAKHDGFAVLTRLRERYPDAEVPTLAVSPLVGLRATALAHKQELHLFAVVGSTHAADFLKRTVRHALGKADEPSFRAAARHPGFEKDRLKRIEELEILKGDTVDDQLQGLVEDAARLFGVPLAAISIIGADKQKLIAQVGFSPQPQLTTERSDSFCRTVVEANDGKPLVVPDAALSPLFRDNRFVREGVLRSYVGAPLITSQGQVLGTLCIADRLPMTINAADVSSLQVLARRVAGELELREARKRKREFEALPEAEVLAEEPEGFAGMTAILGALEQGAVLYAADRTVLFVNAVIEKELGNSAASLVGLTREELLRRMAPRYADAAKVLSSLEIPARGPYALRVEFELKDPRRIHRVVSRPIPFGDGFGQLTLYTDITAEADLRPGA